MKRVEKQPLRRYLVLLIAAALPCGWIAYGQSRSGNWPVAGGDPQRSGWSATETAINKDSVRDLRLLWRLKLETSSRGLNPVSPPLVVKNLISYRGFKELGFVTTNADVAYAVDLDLGKIFWTRHLEYSVRDPQVLTSTPECPGGLTAAPTMPVTAPTGAASGTAGRGNNAFVGGNASVYALSSDGRIHRLNTATGDDMAQPVSVIPANARASSLMMLNNIVYTTTTNNCNGSADALWVIDLGGDGPKARAVPMDKRTVGAVSVGNNGTVYVKTQETKQVPLVLLEALSGPSLESRSVFKLLYEDAPAAASTLSVITHARREMLATSCGEGVCLVDPAAFGTADQIRLATDLKPVLDRVLLTAPGEGRGVNGQLASWQDADGTRWILASVVGQPRSELKKLIVGDAPKVGFVAALKLEDKDGKPTLTPTWISRNIVTPQPVVVTNGVVFALSAGEFTRAKWDDGTIENRPKKGTRATLFALDARTGKELYSSRDQLATPAGLSGMTVANGRVYFSGLDGALYAFGIYTER